MVSAAWRARRSVTAVPGAIPRRHEHLRGFFVNEVKGTWRTATEMALPASAQMAGKNGGVVAVSCRSAGNCSAGAAYLDGSTEYQALVVNEVGGRWETGLKITLPTATTPSVSMAVSTDSSVTPGDVHRDG